MKTGSPIRLAHSLVNVHYPSPHVQLLLRWFRQFPLVDRPLAFLLHSPTHQLRLNLFRSSNLTACSFARLALMAAATGTSVGPSAWPSLPRAILSCATPITTVFSCGHECTLKLVQVGAVLGYGRVRRQQRRRVRASRDGLYRALLRHKLPVRGDMVILDTWGIDGDGKDLEGAKA